MAGTAPALALGLARPWRLDVGTLALDRREMLRYLGYHGQELDAGLAGRIDAVVSDLMATARPAGAWLIAPVRIVGAQPARIHLDGTALELPGRDIFRHLKDARYAAVLACTLGMSAERRLRLLASQQPLEGAVFDAACSALIEQVADELTAQVEDAAAGAGLRCNERYSPGYGDLPLTVQPAVLRALNTARFCGITATPTNLLMPTKSITALVGLFEGEPPARDAVPACARCRVRDGCPFRARGERCYRTLGRGAPTVPANPAR